MTQTYSAPPAQPGSTLDRRTITADGFEIAIWEGGTGAPLLMLHGAGGVALNAAHDLLTETNRVIVVELPGFGDDVNERTQSAQEMADTVIAVADALDIDQFTLHGNSMGGVVALWAAVRHPNRTSALVLESPGAFRPTVDPRNFTPEQLFSAFHRHPERKQISPPDPEKQQLYWPLVEKIMGPEYDYTLAESLTSCEVPTLVMYGTHDGLFGTAPGQEFRRLMPNCTYALVYDAAHEIASDRPEAFVEIVGDFVERRDGFLVSRRSTVRNR